MIFKKTPEELNAIMEEKIKARTPLNYFGDGSIIKSIIGVINETLGQYYEELDFNTSMAFVSKAQGTFLDMIGALLDCTRKTNETDDNYRYRIVHQVYTVAGANETSLRLKCLQHPNVSDVRFVVGVRGTGSFVVYVNIIDKNQTEETLTSIQQIINETKAYGVTAEVVTPKQIFVDIIANLIYSREISSSQRHGIAELCKRNLRNYIDNIEISEPLIVAQLFKHALDTDSLISNFVITRININGKPILLRDYTPRWNEQFVPGNLEIN